MVALNGAADKDSSTDKLINDGSYDEVRPPIEAPRQQRFVTLIGAFIGIAIMLLLIGTLVYFHDQGGDNDYVVEKRLQEIDTGVQFGLWKMIKHEMEHQPDHHPERKQQMKQRPGDVSETSFNTNIRPEKTENRRPSNEVDKEREQNTGRKYKNYLITKSGNVLIFRRLFRKAQPRTTGATIQQEATTIVYEEW